MKTVLKKSTLRGAGSILDILPPRRATKNKLQKKVVKSEHTRLIEAWSGVGLDLRKAIEQYGHGHKTL